MGVPGVFVGVGGIRGSWGMLMGTGGCPWVPVASVGPRDIHVSPEGIHRSWGASVGPKGIYGIQRYIDRSWRGMRGSCGHVVYPRDIHMDPEDIHGSWGNPRVPEASVANRDIHMDPEDTHSSWGHLCPKDVHIGPGGCPWVQGMYWWRLQALGLPMGAH